MPRGELYGERVGWSLLHVLRQSKDRLIQGAGAAQHDCHLTVWVDGDADLTIGTVHHG